MFNDQDLDLNEFEIYDDDDQTDIYEQLERKDKYLMLAAEAGKTLLQKNRALESTIEYLNAEMIKKIEELESDKYKLKSCYNHRESDYHAQLHGLKCDNEVLLKEIEEVKRKNKLSMDQSSRNVKDLMHQIEALKEKLVKASSKNDEFSLQVQTLKRRIEGRSTAAMTNYNEDVNMMEFKMASEQIKKLQSEKRELQSTLDDWASEKIRFIEEVEKSNDRITLLEQRNKYLEQQISIAKSDLDASKTSNVQLKEQLEEYILQASTSGFKASNCLMSELESCLVNSQEETCFDDSMQDPNDFAPICISSPKKPDAYPSQPLEHNCMDSDHMYEHSDVIDINSQERHESVQDLQRQVKELNQKLNENFKSHERLSTKYTLTTNRLKFAETKLEEMQQQMNCMEREVELYKRERDIILSDTTLDEALVLSLEQRRKAFEERNDALDKLEQTKSDLSKLNSQLLEAVQQKVDLAEQLEMWQVDMAALIDRQLKNSSKNERKGKSRSMFFTGRWSWTSVMKPT